MLEILNSIWEFIQSIINLVVMLITSLIQALMFLPSMITSLTESVGYLPPVFALFGTLFITLAIINYVLGRQ